MSGLNKTAVRDFANEEIDLSPRWDDPVPVIDAMREDMQRDLRHAVADLEAGDLEGFENAFNQLRNIVLEINCKLNRVGPYSPREIKKREKAVGTKAK